MSRCARAQDLFGPYWDDETTKAEREWLESHMSECPACRESYDAFARTLGAVAELPRIEASAGLAERSLAAARRVSPARDVIFVRETPAWMPLTAAAAALVLAAALVAPMLMRPGSSPLANRETREQGRRSSTEVQEPRLVAVNDASGRAVTPAADGRSTAAKVADSLFDHTEDVDFVLDPVTLRRGRARSVSHLPQGVRGEQAVISF